MITCADDNELPSGSLYFLYDMPKLSPYRGEVVSRNFRINSVLFFVNLANILMLQVRNRFKFSPHDM